MLKFSESEKILNKANENYKKLIKTGNFSVFENFYKTVPVNLRYQIPNIENNSYLDAKFFCDQNDWPGFRFEHGNILEKINNYEKVTAQEVREIKVILAQQEALFKKLKLMLKNRSFVFAPTDLETITSELGFIRDSAKYLSNSAMISFREGKIDSAIDLVKEIISLALLIENRKGTVVDLLVVNAIKNIARSRIIWILSQKNLSEDQVRSLQSLGVKSNNFTAWENAFKYELFYSAQISITNPFESFHISDEDLTEVKNELSRLPQKLKEEKEFINKFIADCVTFNNEKDVSKKLLKYYSFILSDVLKDLKHFPAQNAIHAKSYLRELIKVHNNYIWQELLTVFSANFICIKVNAYDLNYANAVKTIIAFRLHEIRRHGPPKDLEDLVKAGLLKEIPLDAWSGKPLNLDPVKRTINFDHFIKGQIREIKF